MNIDDLKIGAILYDEEVEEVKIIIAKVDKGSFCMTYDKKGELRCDNNACTLPAIVCLGKTRKTCFAHTDLNHFKVICP